MKATELRIWNVVMYQGEVAQIESMERDHHFIHPNWRIGLVSGDWVYEDDLQPIPLDEAVLAKCGMRLIEKEGVQGELWEHAHSGQRVFLCDDQSIAFTDDNHFVYGIWHFDLHSFQNAFYSLTSSELTYTP